MEKLETLRSQRHTLQSKNKLITQNMELVLLDNAELIQKKGLSRQVKSKLHVNKFEEIILLVKANNIKNCLNFFES